MTPRKGETREEFLARRAAYAATPEQRAASALYEATPGRPRSKRAAGARYNAGPKRRASRARYNASPKGAATSARYVAGDGLLKQSKRRLAARIERDSQQLAALQADLERLIHAS